MAGNRDAHTIAECKLQTTSSLTANSSTAVWAGVVTAAVRALLAMGLAGTAAVIPLQAEDWPQWRGPAGTGASSETSLPVTCRSNPSTLA